MRQNITVTLCSVRAWDIRDWPGDSLVDAIEWLQAKLASVPEPDRKSAKIEFGADDCVPTIEVAYRRSETDQEMADRETRETAFATATKLNREAEERETLRRLKAKYETAP